MDFKVIFKNDITGHWAWSLDYVAEEFSNINNYNIVFEQNGIRAITFTSLKNDDLSEIFDFAQNITQLLYIAEGMHHKISKVTYKNNSGEEEESKDMDLLHYFLVGSHRNFKQQDFELFQPKEIFKTNYINGWLDFKNKITMQLSAFFYFTSDNGLPIDLRLANLVELCEPLAELDGMPVPDGQNKRFLKDCVDYLATKYIPDLFRTEKSMKLYDTQKGILTRIVNSRHNILHYSLNPGVSFIDNRSHLNDNETSLAAIILYSAKIHLLLRVVFLEKAGITVPIGKLQYIIKYIEKDYLENINPNLSFDDFIRTI